MIHFSHLNFHYPKGSPLFDDLSFTQESGSIVGLLGVNGSGKSTLMKLISGLLNEPAASICVMGSVPFKREPSFLEQLFLVPEDYIFEAVTIKKYVKLYAKFYPHFDHDKLEGIIEQFNLDCKQRLNKLSYGQKKKFFIAFALATNCKLLLFDEPTNGLDIPSKAIFRQVLASSVSEEQLVLISTHQVKDVENLIDKIIIIDQGKVVFQKSLWDISENFVFINSRNPQEAHALYQEPAAGGYKVIKPGSGIPTPVDIELLFNAVIKGVDLN